MTEPIYGNRHFLVARARGVDLADVSGNLIPATIRARRFAVIDRNYRKILDCNLNDAYAYN